jgi:rhodanese-related sulfurtransferase
MSSAQLFKQALYAVFFVLIASLIALGVNTVRPNPLPLVYDWVKAAESNQPDGSGVEVWNLERFKTDYQKPGVVVLDARPIDFFNMSHIPGARSLPLEQADAELAKLLTEIPEDAIIVTYCDGPFCPAAHDLAKKLVQAGRRNVNVFVGGMEIWSQAGLPEARNEGEGA